MLIPAITQVGGNDKNHLISSHDVWKSIEKTTGGVRMQMLPPSGNNGVWRAAHMERTDPLKRFDLLLDAYSGEVLYLSTWKEQTWFGKATAVGIPFHRGEYGGSSGCWAQVILRCRADLTQLLCTQMGTAFIIFLAAKN